jgi:hypothetical protein
LRKQTVALFLILSLLYSILSVALTSSEQINQTFGAESDDSKPKEKKSDSKSKNEDKSEDKTKTKDKSKDDTKSKEDNTKSNEDKSKDKIIIKENDDDKPKDDISTTLPENTSPQPPVTTDNQLTSPAPTCDPSTQSCPPTTPTTNPNDIPQQPCDSTKNNCPLINNSNDNIRCPADYHTNHDGSCHYVGKKCNLPKEQCPPLDCKITECPKDLKCSNGYHRDVDGLCHRVDCNISKESCLVCDPITKKCSTSVNKNRTTEITKTDTVIKYYITNPIIQQQVAQQPLNVLIPMDTLQFCNLIGDQACVFMNNNFKILFNQTIQDNLGNWVLNGEAQNIGSNPINNVLVVWHLYDAFGNIVGLTQGFPSPSNLGIGQTTIFNLQENPTSLTGIPKFYRISFVF